MGGVEANRFAALRSGATFHQSLASRQLRNFTADAAFAMAGNLLLVTESSTSKHVETRR